MSFDEDLVCAIMQGNISILESFDLEENMINQKISFSPKIRCQKPNIFVLPNVNFPTPLIYAICCHQYNVVSFLLNRGANLSDSVNSKSYWYPIHYAVASRDTDLIDVILNFLNEKKVSDPQSELERKTDDDGATPLHMAVSGSDIDTILYLLNQGCDTNSQNNQGQTPLHLSMAFTDDFIARALLAYNSDLSITDNHGNKPYTIAKKRGNQNLSDTILLYENQDERPDKKEICLEAAQRQDSNNHKMKIIAFRNNERAKKKFMSNTKPISSSNSTNINSNPINDDENQRFQDIESKIEELNESMTKLKARVLTSPPSSLLTRNNIHCEGCLSPHATLCPTCNLYFCETCMKKPKFHKCTEKY